MVVNRSTIFVVGQLDGRKGITLTEEELVKLYEVLKAEVEFLQSDDL